jgi:hypothetical protein
MKRLMLVSLAVLTCQSGIVASAEDDVASLAKKLSDKDIKVRVEAAKALGAMGEKAKDAAPALLDAYQEMERFEKANARIISGEVAPTDAEQRRILAELERLGALFHESATALGNIGPAAVIAVPVLMKDVLRMHSGVATETLLKIDPSKAVMVDEIMIVLECMRLCMVQQNYFDGDSRVNLPANRRYATSFKEAGKWGVGDAGDAEGPPGKAKPSFGYCVKVLWGQGANAPGGKMSYLVDGKMTRGFALIAYPAEYGKSGKRTFMVVKLSGQPERMYARDLGADTVGIIEKMTECDPVDWQLVKDPTKSTD